MKKKLIVLLVAALTTINVFNSFAEELNNDTFPANPVDATTSNWHSEQVDKNLIVKFPTKPTLTDRSIGGQTAKVYQTMSNSVIYLTAVAGHDSLAKTVKSKEVLNENYDNFVKGLVQKRNGSIIEKNLLTINNFDYYAVKSNITISEVPTLSKMMVIWLDGTYYSIEAMYNESEAIDQMKEIDAYFSSITILADPNVIKQYDPNSPGLATNVSIDKSITGTHQENNADNANGTIFDKALQQKSNLLSNILKQIGILLLLFLLALIVFIFRKKIMGLFQRKI